MSGEALWEITQCVAEESSLYEHAGHYHCNYCIAKYASVHLALLISRLDISEDPENARQDFILNFPHDVGCIVTKARQLIEWRNTEVKP